MDMKQHILTALVEEYNDWEDLLAGLRQEQLGTPLQPSHWTPKDVVAHLRAWQSRSVTRLEAACTGKLPVFPTWLPGVDPDMDANTEPVNTWIYESNREKTWVAVHDEWREGFQKFLELGDRLPERDLLDSGRYPWLNGSPLAWILLSSYDHHQEHFEKLVAWLKEHGQAPAR